VEEEEVEDDLDDAETEKQGAQADFVAKKEFFYLTALACKLNHDLKEDLSSIPTSDLYEKALKEEVPFFRFGEWIEKEMTKSYLASSRDKRLQDLQSGNLRDRRAQSIQSIQKRKH